MRRLVLSVVVTLAIGAAPAAASPVPCLGVGGLQDALDTATPGTTIQLISGSHCTGTAYHFTAGHVPVTLDGNGATLDGTGISPSGPILSGTDVGTTTIENLTFVDGNVTSGDGGALDLTGDSIPNLVDDQFYGNTAQADGGAVAIVSSASTGQITVRGSTFGSPAQPNTTGGRGGGLAISGTGGGMGTPSVLVTGDHFEDNQAGGGAGLDFAPRGSNGTITISDSLFVANQVKFDGGGAGLELYGVSHPHATLIGNTFATNTAQSDSNFADGAGLDIYGPADGTGSVLQEGNTFAANSILRTTETGTQFYGSGGGEYDEFASLVSIGDSFENNSIVPNTASDVIWGAGLAVGGCGTGMPAVLTDDVVAGNVAEKGAPAGGAGVYVGILCMKPNSSVGLALHDTTISGNTARSGGVAGVLGESTDTLSASNSIIAGNPGGSSDVGGFASRTVDHSDACSSGAVLPGAGNICKNPLLKNPLSGDVHETATSPTIDRGIDSAVPKGLTKDVFGKPRITDGLGTPGPAVVDMGAAESPAKGVCIVPRLKGKSLDAARTALRKAHCALGKVRHQRSRRRHGKVVVVAQAAPPGKRLKTGSKVGVTLGRSR